jgi:hypothetical protein
VSGTHHATPAVLELLASFGFNQPQKREVWTAYLEQPDALELLAQRARAYGRREGTTGAGLLLAMIRRGDLELESNPHAARVTGWRMVRGTHGVSYKHDAAGVDPLPANYSFERGETNLRAREDRAPRSATDLLTLDLPRNSDEQQTHPPK